MSVDEDDQLIYIEVKSTNGSDPVEPFYISHAELIEATYRRSRYYVYRVTDVDSTAPTITRWADPLGLIKEGKGRLLLAKAQMALSLDDEEGGESGGSRTDRTGCPHHRPRSASYRRKSSPVRDVMEFRAVAMLKCGRAGSGQLVGLTAIASIEIRASGIGRATLGDDRAGFGSAKNARV